MLDHQQPPSSAAPGSGRATASASHSPVASRGSGLPQQKAQQDYATPSETMNEPAKGLPGLTRHLSLMRPTGDTLARRDSTPPVATVETASPRDALALPASAGITPLAGDRLDGIGTVRLGTTTSGQRPLRSDDILPQVSLTATADGSQTHVSKLGMLAGGQPSTHTVDSAGGKATLPKPAHPPSLARSSSEIFNRFTGGTTAFGPSHIRDDLDAFVQNNAAHQRSRQPSSATVASDGSSSVTSLPFGPASFYAPAISKAEMHTPDTSRNAFAAFAAGPSAVFSPMMGASPASNLSSPPVRSDSGYGASPLSTLANSRTVWGPPRRSQPPGPFGSPAMSRGSFAESPFPPAAPGPFGSTSPFSLPVDLSADFARIGLGTSSQHSSSSSLYRLGSGGTSGSPGEYAPGARPSPASHGYGLGLVGPMGPYVPIQMHSGYEHRMVMREDRSRPIRSPLLEEFRADKSRRWGVKDMLGHIAEFMTDQVGSRYLQEHILENPTAEDCDLIYEEVFPVILQLSVDVFANFCVQRLFEKANEDQVANMAHGLKGSILRLSLQTYGCRVIQKAIEVVSPETQVIIIRELEGSVQKCVRDQNANHVVQKIVQTVPADALQFVVDAFVGHVYTFATHPYSCRVLQRIFENCPDRMTRPLLEELKSYAQNLMQDQYGNYVVQFILEKGFPQDKSDIITQIYGQVLHLSKHKFASNVIEKCIMNANEQEIQAIAGEVLAPRVDGTTGILSMLKHEYANYPLQRLIKHTSGTLHIAIVDQVSAQLAQFRMANPPFTAKHLIAVEKLLLDISPDSFPTLMPRRYEDHYLPRAR